MRTTCQERAGEILIFHPLISLSSTNRVYVVPVVGLGELVGHGQDGKRPVLLRAERLIDTSAVDQTSLSALDEDLTQQLLVILTVHVEGLGDKRQTDYH